jgi:hypothetical protein
MTASHPVTIDDVISALALPDRTRLDQRVPKKMLAEHAPTSADRRLLTDGIEEMQWVAALKPGTVAIPEHRSEEREYLEVAVLAVQVRASHVRPSQLLRLTELVHRAVPYPVFLVQALAGAEGTGKDSVEPLAISLVHKRASQNEASKTVLDGELIRSALGGMDAASTAVTRALLEALALNRQPQHDLSDLYQGWMDCLTAAQAARITGHFHQPSSSAEAAAQREALRKCQQLEQEATRLRNLAAKERQIAKQVDLNLALQRLEAGLKEARARL